MTAAAAVCDDAHHDQGSVSTRSACELLQQIAAPYLIILSAHDLDGLEVHATEDVVHILVQERHLIEGHLGLEGISALFAHILLRSKRSPHFE